MVKRTSDTIYHRGYESEPFVYCATQGESNIFSGAAFAVDSFSDLELATQTLPLATPIHDLDAPGGGKRVIFHDPVDNCPFHLVYGQAAVEPSVSFPELEYNFQPLSTARSIRLSDSSKALRPYISLAISDYASQILMLRMISSLLDLISSQVM